MHYNIIFIRDNERQHLAVHADIVPQPQNILRLHISKGVEYTLCVEAVYHNITPFVPDTHTKYGLVDCDVVCAVLTGPTRKPL